MTEPRLWTPPLRDLDDDTSNGPAVVQFARSLGVKLMPWQEWALLHGLELREDGRYRFRTVVVLVSRQNGKSTIAQVLALWRMVSERALVLGTSTNLEMARESWMLAVDLAEDQLDEDVASVKRGALDTSLRLNNGSRYLVRAANRRGGRGLSVDLAILDELREHQSWDGWSAVTATTAARPNPQTWCFSNAGDDSSLVLNRQREFALGYIQSGEGDDSLALFEWSAPEDCDLTDRAAWAQANPALGHTITEATLVSYQATDPAEVFRTEHLCQRVATLDAAVDMVAWRDARDPHLQPGDLLDNVALCLDVSPDMRHVTLVAAVKDAGGVVRVGVVEAWESVDRARQELPEWFDKIDPRVVGWFPNGPGAALAADLRNVRKAEPIKPGEVSAVCLGLAEQILARRILHNGDPMLTSQLDGTAKLWTGDGWRFARRGVGHCDAVYALAGAVHLARTLPPPRPKLVVL